MYISLQLHSIIKIYINIAFKASVTQAILSVSADDDADDDK